MAKEHALKEKYAQLRQIPKKRSGCTLSHLQSQKPTPPSKTPLAPPIPIPGTISTTLFPSSKVVSCHSCRSLRNYSGSAARLPNLPPTLRDAGAHSRSLNAAFADDISGQPLPRLTALQVSTRAATVTPGAARRFSHMNSQETPAGVVRIAPAPSSG